MEVLEKTLADPELFSDKNKSVPLLEEYKAARQKLDEQLLKWEQRQNKLEATKQELGIGDR